jgi:hypothetical protein
VPSPKARRKRSGEWPFAKIALGKREASGEPKKRLSLVSGLVLALSLATSGCGGGSATAQALAVAPGFAISFSANSVSVTQGATSAPLTISVNSQGGFNADVEITLSGLPNGVVATPASPFSVAPGSSVAILFGAGPNAAAGAYTITAAGVSGSLSNSATFSLSVQSIVGYSAQVYANRNFSGESSPYKFLLYDKTRQFVYLSAPGSIDVFDLQAAAFKASGLTLYCPSYNSPGPCPNDDVRGLTLTPDGTQLIAADFGSQNVYLLNPGTPATPATAISVSSTSYNPTRVAAANTQTVFVALSAEATTSGICTACLSEIDLSASPPTLESTPEPVVSNLVGSPLLQGDAAGDRVFFAYATPPGGPLGLWTSPGTFTMSPTNETAIDLVAPSDGTLFATVVGSSIEVHGIDSNLTLLSTFAAPPQNVPGRVSVPGIAMHPSGALVYQPFLPGPAPPPPQPGAPLATGTQSGVDILDSHTGVLRLRVLLPEPLAATSADVDGLHAQFIAVDEKGQRIFALTVSGLTAVQLVNVPLGIGTLSPASGPATGGTAVTIRGSGFQTGTTAAIGGTSVSVMFKDMNTLTIVTPGLSPGAQQLVLANPDGETVSLDGAFTAQ